MSLIYLERDRTMLDRISPTFSQQSEISLEDNIFDKKCIMAIWYVEHVLVVSRPRCRLRQWRALESNSGVSRTDCGKSYQQDQQAGGPATPGIK
jgi:hypothetical protein